MGITKRAAMVSLLVALSSTTALADIGGVGGIIGGVTINDQQAADAKAAADAAAKDKPPVDPSTVEKPFESSEKPLAPGEERVNRKQVLAIPFEQRHVYFQRQLRDTLTRNSPQADYEIVSYYPISQRRMQEERNITTAQDNAAKIRQEMIDQGVPPARVKVSTKALEQGRDTPEVRLYTN